MNVVEISKIKTSFIKANSFLLNNFKENFNNATTDAERESTLKDLWLDQFNSVLIKNNNHYYAIQFKSEKQLNLFLLRF